MGYLRSLEIENFKSYKGKHVIGPFKRFSSIIGPNGSGKSNLMDAICFVLGEKTQNLRVRKLGDLIHGAPIGQPVGTRCHVSMFFVYDDETERVFTRTVTSGGSEYRVDGSTVTPAQYHEYLEEINIFIKAKNFLVYQGAVESIAMKTPKERTQLFEELSKSGDLASEYNKLKAEMIKAEEDAQFNLNKRRGVALEKREAKMEKDEAERYQALKDDLASKQIQLYLVQICHAEQGREKAKLELGKIREEIKRVREERKEKDDIVHAKQRKHRQLVKEYNKLEDKVANAEKKINDFRPKCTQNEQELVHTQQKIETVKKFHQTMLKQAEDQEKNLKKLEKERDAIIQKRRNVEANMAAESQKGEVHLDELHIQEYKKLKAVSESQSVALTAKIDEAKQQRESIVTSMQHQQHMLKTLDDRTKQKENELERQRQGLQNLEDTKNSQLQALEAEKAGVRELEDDVKNSKKELERLTIELQNLNNQISDAHGDSMESERSRRKHEAVENLKRLFPEKVYGRLVELCTPSNKKYQLAITKVMGSNMNAIAVDSDDTAEECIAYLKEQRYMSEKFLPLNSLDCAPINEKLREIGGGVRLLYDVINCTQPSVKKAIQFACNNAVVCDTPEEARQMAFGRDNHRLKSVALDGTLFQQNGVISGGGSELRARAKKWDEQGMKKLREQRKELQDQCNSLHRNRKRELDVEMKRNQILQIENRIRHNEIERQRLNNVIPRLVREVEVLRGQLQLIQPQIESMNAELQRIDTRISEYEQQKGSTVDNVFASFCQRVGIKDIREYENREVRFHQEKQNELSAIDVELDRLKYEINFHKSENRREREQREAGKIETLKKEKKRLEAKIKEQNAVLKEYEAELEAVEKEAEVVRLSVADADEEVHAAKKEVQSLDREVNGLEKKARNMESLETRKAAKRHSLLHECKIAGIDLPLSSGSLNDVMIDEGPEDAETTVPTLSQESLKQADRVVVCYDSLNYPQRKLKDESEVNKIVEKLNKAVADAHADVAKIAAPNMKANERMEQVREKEAEISEESDNARKKARKARQAFEKIKNDRIRLFNAFFEPVTQRIDEIYKQLSRNEGAQAFLGAENLEEPYLDGLIYNCVAPGKRFRPMDNLSGGEKTIAALALLFAIHSQNPSPFFVLDEIDAALDNTNIGKVVGYIAERAQSDMQLIVISLKEELYNKADALVGIYPKPAHITTSGVLSFDLANFKANLNETATAAD
uniref:Structural maintenance of chromosomes protein n=1 Tax=Panagrellus redivivus TaxID=6233 RepID=A0A7E4V931_PANRE